jgi:NAD-dependent SIR2 family protein deacetylase
MPFRKNVFVLGAGFSADAGAPVMHDFLPTAKHLLDDDNSGLLETDRDAFKRVFDFLRELRAAGAKITLDLENIEHLFGLAEMDLEFGGRNRGSFRRDLILLILRTLERSIRSEKLPRSSYNFPIREAGVLHTGWVEANYGEMFAALASRRWLDGKYGIPHDGICLDTVITMNYDCFLDDALSRLGIRPDYGLLDSDYPSEWTSLQCRMSVLKLHGSANWFQCKSERCKGKVYVISDKEPGSRMWHFYGTPCRMCGYQPDPVIVPPTWAKGNRIDLFGPIWTRALEALKQAGRIFVIGYSMPNADSFFQYMLGLALAVNEDIEKIVIVNPDARIGEKFAGLFHEHFRDRKLVLAEYNTSYVTDRLLGDGLGQYKEGLSRDLILASGFKAN